MKQLKTTIFILLFIALVFPSGAYAKENRDDRVVFGGTFTLESGETHVGSLVVFGGAVTTEPESVVNGDVVLIGGTVEIGGTVNGNVVGIGGAVRLESEAIVNGDIFTMGATLRREDGASVNGQVINGVDAPFTFTSPDGASGGEIELPALPQTPQVNINANPLLDMIWFTFRIFLYAGLAVLVVMFLSGYVEKVTQAAIAQPVITGAAGLVTAILAPLALVAITITIILIPVTLVAVILLFAAWLLGWVALGLEVGRRVSRSLNMEWAPAISAGVGTLIISFVLGGFKELVPCIGWLPYTLVGLWGLGAVLLTRFGTQVYIGPEDRAGGEPSDLLEADFSEPGEAQPAEPVGSDDSTGGDPLPEEEPHQD